MNDIVNRVKALYGENKDLAATVKALTKPGGRNPIRVLTDVSSQPANLSRPRPPCEAAILTKRSQSTNILSASTQLIATQAPRNFDIVSSCLADDVWSIMSPGLLAAARASSTKLGLYIALGGEIVEVPVSQVTQVGATP